MYIFFFVFETYMSNIFGLDNNKDISGSTVQTSSIQHSTDIVNKDYVDTHHGGGGGGNPNPTQNIN